MSERIGPGSPAPATDIRDKAAAIGRDWRDAALCTQPADRPAAEAAIVRLYQAIGADPPRFAWVDSPAGLYELPEHLRPDPRSARLRASSMPERGSDWPAACRIADRLMRLRERLCGQFWWRRMLPLPSVPAYYLRYSEDLTGRAVRAVREPMDAGVRDAVAAPLRTAIHALDEASPGLMFAGQFDAVWLAPFDVLHRLGLARCARADTAELGLWQTLARSCGWWWPGEEVCVVSERPRTIHTEPAPATRSGRRLHREDGPAVDYPDGWGVCALHGTVVPEWVLAEPTMERIQRVYNTEVRRVAIERLGWDHYIARAGLRPVASAPDPGNPGSELHLYDPPPDIRFPPSRVLLAVNGSVERDGTRRRYGLTVPDGIDDPVAAAAWTYGLPRAVYARLARRT